MSTGDEYHQVVKARPIADPLVCEFDIQCERRIADDGYLGARSLLHDEEEVEFSESIRRVRYRVQVVMYSLHWTDANGNRGSLFLRLAVVLDANTPRGSSR